LGQFQLHGSGLCSKSVQKVSEHSSQDPGPGFDVSKVADPTSEEGHTSSNGRGIHMMKAHMNDVTFAQQGREVQAKFGHHGVMLRLSAPLSQLGAIDLKVRLPKRLSAMQPATPTRLSATTYWGL